MPPPRAVTPFAWLALTVQLVSERVLFSQSIPPPRAVPEEMTWLLLMKESVIVAVPPVVLMPPPLEVARLLRILLETTFNVALLAMPPPATAELFLTVELSRVRVVPTPGDRRRDRSFRLGGVAVTGSWPRRPPLRGYPSNTTGPPPRG